MKSFDLIRVANQIYGDQYSDAGVVLLCGSYVRGEHTETSDLDLVVLYEEIPHAYRESYYYQDWPIEAFVHDMQTLHYFFDEVDRPSGIPSLMQMVDEGIAVPGACGLSDQAKELAREYLEMGPPKWEKGDIDRSRYAISDLIEDLRGATGEVDQHAILVRLYEQFADYYFRSRGLWSGKGKWIPRRLKEVDVGFAEEVFAAMRMALRGEGVEPFAAVVEKELDKDGGKLFEGFRLDAPVEWRK